MLGIFIFFIVGIYPLFFLLHFLYHQKISRYLLLSIFIFWNVNLFSQSSSGKKMQEQKQLYKKAFKNIKTQIDTAQACYDLLEKQKSMFSPVMRAKLSYLRLKIFEEVEKGESIENNKSEPPVDTLNTKGFLFFTAQQYMSQSDSDKGIPLLLELLKLTDKNTDAWDYYSLYLAEAYRQKGEYKKGHNIISTVLSNKNISSKNKAFAYNRMAAIFNEWRLFNINVDDTVVKYSRLSIQISEKYGYTHYLSISQNELANQYKLKKEYKKASRYCERAIFNFLKNEHIFEAMNTSINLSNIHLSLKQYTKAKQVIDQALSLCRIEENPYLFMRLFLQNAKVYELSGEYEAAYEFLSIARKMQQNANRKKSDKTINEMSAKYDLELKESKIRDEQQKNKIQKQRILFLFVILIVLIITFVFINIGFRLKQKIRLQKEAIVKQENMKLKTTLEFKEKELHYKTKELSQAITNIISYNETLRDIKKTLQMASNNETLKIINNNLISNHNWDTFKLTFNNVYPSFFIRIQEALPELTENEIKLCAFLVMDLKTREIANIVNISESSVSKRRNRLRKKLQLEKRENIAMFLKKI